MNTSCIPNDLTPLPQKRQRVHQIVLSIFYPVNLLAIYIFDGNGYWYAAIQAVCSAGHSGVIGPNGHLHLVQQAFVINAIFDKTGSSLFYAHVHRRNIMGCTHNQIRFGDTAIIISGVIMN